MNVKVLIAVALLAVAAVFGFTSFRKAMTPYLSFAEARTARGMVQVNGTLANKNYVLESERQFLKFDLKDSKGEVLPVEYHGVIPGNFDQATSIVAIGRYENGTFAADQLLVKCPSKYQAEAEKKGAGAT
jgi:cytochrome c-type biogenesis protein CcmE